MTALTWTLTLPLVPVLLATVYAIGHPDRERREHAHQVLKTLTRWRR